MLIDLRTAPEATERTSDVCVIGAGAAGISLARKLAQLGHDVCLLESGGLDFEQSTQDLFKGANVGMPYYDLEESRLRFFGGTVAIWGGRCALLDPIDFERRDWVPHSGWPINRTDLDPYYRAAHKVFDLGEFNYEHDVWNTLGLPSQPFDPEQLALSLWRFDEVAERFTASRAKDLFEGNNIRVLLHANVVKLQAGPDARTIEHIEVRTLEGPVRKIRARQFVLACGAIENSRLLLASNDVERAGIGNQHDQVGRFFMEHPCGRIGKVTTPHSFEIWDAFQKRFMPSGPPLAPVLRLSEATQRRERALNSIVTFKLQGDPKKGVALGNQLYHKLKHSIAPNRRGRILDHAYRGVRAWIHREVRTSIEKLRVKAGMADLYLICRGEQAPNPDSRILLSDQLDAFGNRRADLAWQLNEQDKHTARVIIQTFDRELRRTGRGFVQASEWLSDASPQWPIDPTVGNHPLAGYHHMGGTRMSEEPASGVVDPHCRVHGYANLHVSGSSVFSTGSWANPTLTIVALALRLADRLSEELKHG